MGKDKLDRRWENGIWLGMRDESGETLVGTSEGVVKCRDFQRKTMESERWSKSGLDSIKGVPWEPTPGRSGDYVIKTRVVMQEESGPVSKPVVGREPEVLPRRAKIYNTDLGNDGHQGMPRVQSSQQGSTSPSPY